VRSLVSSRAAFGWTSCRRADVDRRFAGHGAGVGHRLAGRRTGEPAM